MGGGESLSACVHLFPPNAVHFSVNDHGCRLMRHTLKIARLPDYVVACDKIEQRVRFDIRPPGTGAAWDVPVIGRWGWADYRMLFSVAPNSGVAAAWAARLMGCAPIILAGMDLYQGPTYFDDANAYSGGRSIPPQDHRPRWWTLAEHYPAMYRMLGGDAALASRLGVYAPDEPVRLPPPPVHQLALELERYRIRLLMNSTIAMRDFAAGAVVDVAKRERDKLVKERRAESIPVNDE
jgi:hypothetical protein